MAIEFADCILSDDIDVVLAAVRNKYQALQFVHPTMQDNQIVVDAAMQQSALALEFASQRFRMDIKRAKQACQADSLALRFTQCVNDDDEVVRDCVSRNGLAFRSSVNVLELAQLTCDDAAKYATWRCKLSLMCRATSACFAKRVSSREVGEEATDYMLACM